MMKTSDKGITLIKSFEGCVLTAYKCPSGVWTIGYGHTAGVKQGQTITQAQAEEFLKADIVKYENYVNNKGLSLNQNQFDALVSFTYNCGAGNLTTLVKNRTLKQIADALLLYNKSNGKVLAGLKKRRQAERALFLTPYEEREGNDMTVKIGHASIDERGEISGGVAGDQTGKEVCTRNFYMHAKGWIVLRAKDPEVAEKIAQCMEWACANPYVGYDQYERLDLYNSVKNLKFKCDINTLKVYVECDCSSLVRTCLAYAGVMVGNFTTSNEKAVILASGAFTEVTCKSDGSNLKRGDILVTKTKGHTVVVLSNGANVTNKAESEEYDMQTIKRGSKGKAVKVWQIIVGATPDGDFGANTEKLTKSFQDEKGLVVDGIVGAKSWKAGLETL